MAWDDWWMNEEKEIDMEWRYEKQAVSNKHHEKYAKKYPEILKISYWKMLPARPRAEKEKLNNAVLQTEQKRSWQKN